MAGTDRAFSGSIPELYDRYLVPLLFEPYAVDLAGHVANLPLERLLELAAGTGVVTRELARSLPAAVEIVATDLSQAMLDVAATRPIAHPVTWRQADAAVLPFEDGAFDTVVCQFGVMFFPDKISAYREARRVLKPGGAFVFSVWDRIEENEIAQIVHETVAALFPDDPPGFLARIPYGYHDTAAIEEQLRQAGFAQVSVETVEQRSRAASPRDPAVGLCHGSPLQSEIEARGPGQIDQTTNAAASALAARFGRGSIDAGMRAHLVTAIR
jgi:ubiquinone/menaquinone biosynthesis C-methylase UbiE